jgi:hypothetical protein
MQASQLEQRMQARMSQEDQLRTLQFQAKQALLEKAKVALDNDDLDLFNILSSQAMAPVMPSVDTPDATISLSPGDTLTPHEKLLDAWRVVTTIILVLALFVVLAFVLHSAAIAKTATPYVSLVSGLAGIALGWMFAGAGNSGRQSRSRPSKGKAPVVVPEQTGAAASGGHTES